MIRADASFVPYSALWLMITLYLQKVRKNKTVLTGTSFGGYYIDKFW